MIEQAKIVGFGKRGRFFAETKDKKKVFCQVSDYSSILVKNGTDGKPEVSFYGYGGDDFNPRIGNIIYFERDETPDGLIAIRWCFFWEYEFAVKDFEESLQIAS